MHFCFFGQHVSLSPITVFVVRASLGLVNSCIICRYIRRISTHDVYHNNIKIASLSRAGNMEAARQLFDGMPKKDVVSWNSIVTGHWQNGLFEISKRLFGLMPEKNVVSWNCMIAGCVENDRIDEAFDYFQAMPKRNTASWNAMISGFVKQNSIEEANKLFQDMPRRNVISYTTMMDGYANNGEIELARSLFECIPDKNGVTWTVMISGYLGNGRFHEAKELFDRMPDKNVEAITAMISGYCKEGDMENARILFDGMQYKDQVAWNTMITGYAQNGRAEEALRLFSEMLKMGMQLDHLTLVSVLATCSSLASLTEGRQTHVHVVKNGFELDVSVCNALTTMYGKCGVISDSHLAFRHIRKPDLVSWNTIISSFAQHGLLEMASDIFNQMISNHVEPDGLTFLSLLSACGHAGKVHESINLFNSMDKSYAIAPRSEHYACLIDTLSRAGELEKAFKILEEMPSEADSGASWSAFLSACISYTNVELAEVATKKILGLDPQNSGAYVMLSNLYAACGMWSEVKRVRISMKDQGVKKQQALSWMQIGNEVHSFLGGDISHPDIDKIHLELKSIRLQMKTMAMGDIAKVVSGVQACVELL